ncbi:MAG: hypothetical protein AB1609_18800 [Bacillota bacterium]
MFASGAAAVVVAVVALEVLHTVVREAVAAVAGAMLRAGCKSHPGRT